MARRRSPEESGGPARERDDCPWFRDPLLVRWGHRAKRSDADRISSRGGGDRRPRGGCAPRLHGKTSARALYLTRDPPGAPRPRGSPILITGGRIMVARELRSTVGQLVVERPD